MSTLRAVLIAVLSAALPAVGAAATYAVGGPAPAGGAKGYPTLQAFSAAVSCLNAGDRVVLAGNETHRGTLSLKPCDPSAQGTVTIQGTSAEARARLDPSASSAELKLSWTAAGAGTPSMPRTTGLDIFALGPLEASVRKVTVSGLDAGPSVEPDPATPRQPTALLLSAVRTQRDGCGAWMCLRSADPAWATQLKRMQGQPETGWPALVLRNSPWSFTRHRIVGVDAGSAEVRIAAAEGSTGVAEDRDFVEPGFGVIFVHGMGGLDRAGEWVQDERTRQLFLAMPAGTSPGDLAERVRLSLAGRNAEPALAFEAERRGSAARLTLVVRHLDIVGAAGPAIRVRGIGTVEVARNVIRDAAENGVQIADAARVVVADNEISDTGNNGILVTESAALEIRGNRIRNAGRIGVQPLLTMQFNGMRAAGFTSADIRENEISDVGFAGIMLAERGAFEGGGQARLVVSGNTIRRFCQMLNDCGAIYINGGGKGRDKPEPVDPSIEKRIVNNRIDEPEPNLQGLPAGRTDSSPPKNRTGAWVRMVGAVYLDHGASGYDVRGNTVGGVYTPFGWNVFNGGIENACTRQSLAQCKTGPKPFRCYTEALSACNQVPPRPAK